MRQARRRTFFSHRMRAGIRLEVLPEFAERAFEHLSKRASAEVRHPPGRLFGEFRDRFGPEAIRKVLMKVRAIRVLRRSAWPIDQSAVRAIDWIESQRSRRAIDDHPEVACRHPPFARQDTFVIRGDSFDLPEGKEQIG